MKNLILICTFVLLISCSANDDGMIFFISINNISNYSLENVSIEMDTGFSSVTADSVYIQNIASQNESEEYVFHFDRTSGDLGMPLLAQFDITYSQDESIKYSFIVMDDRDSNHVTLVIEDDSYYIEEN